MIDIIIPCYNAHSTIDRTLGSILAQIDSGKCKITLANDAGNTYEDVIKRYPSLNIQEIRYDENKGPGAARNFGIDNTNEQYIMFVDADDTLYSPFTISTILNTMQSDTAFLINNIIAENPDGTTRIIKSNRNFLHGKVYNRSFIEKYNIRFKECRCCEDASFNLIAYCLCNPKEKLLISDYTAYAWLYNENSLGRKNPAYWEYCEVPRGTVENLIYSFEELEKRNCKETLLISEKVRGMIWLLIIWLKARTYYPQFNEDNNKTLKTYYNIYQKIESQVTDELFDSIVDLFNLPEKEKHVRLFKQILSDLQKGVL